MEVVSLDIAKKLSRRKLQKGQTTKMYQKRSNCAVYDLKDNFKNAYCSYDAPNINELKKIAEYLRLTSQLLSFNDVNEYAEKLIHLSKKYREDFSNVRI